MKKWDKQIPVMSSASIAINYRNQLWAEIRDNPNLDVIHVNKITAVIAMLNKRINQRSISPRELEDITKEVKRVKNPSRVAKKIKRSRRQINFILNKKRKTKSNGNNKKARKEKGS